MKALPVVDDLAPVPPTPAPGPLEQALASLWPVARARLLRLSSLPTLLLLRRRFRLDFLQPHQLAIRVPAGQVPDCESCTELCCTGENAVVSLRLLDVARLVDGGLERAIVHERPAAPPARATWARREADASIFHRTFPVLARDATRTCVLLTEDRRCGAWPSWPLSCARYPYALDLLGRSVFYAKGCTSSVVLPYPDAPIRTRRLVDAVVQSYNERVKDVVLLHTALPELADLGLLRFLRLEGALAKKAARLQRGSPGGAA